MFTDPPVDGATIKPNYREAYPELRIVSVRRAWRDKLRICQWFNERGELVARMELLSWRNEALSFHYEWMQDGERHERRVELEVLHRPTVTNRRMPDALCRGCQRVQPILYLTDGDWRCAGCLGLVARATLLTTAEKMLLQVT